MAGVLNGLSFKESGGTLTLTYRPGNTGGKYQIGPNGTSATLTHGRGSIGVSSSIAQERDGSISLSGPSMTLGFKTPGGVELGVKLTPTGTTVPHPTDPYAAPIPNAKADFTLGHEKLGSIDIPLTDETNPDRWFDPELGGIASKGLLGNAYNFLRHRDRDINDQYREATGENFQDAKGWTRPVDPLVLDLDGDGIETVGANGKVVFDHEGNAVREGTGWISADDGILVLDRNGNGTIDDGSELFGDHTPGAELAPGQSSIHSAGLRALSTLDLNGDGKVDASDEAFASLQVWRDLNQDGVSQAGELFTLSELGIRSITVEATDRRNVALGNGNTVDSYGSFEREDGTTGVTADLLLASNNFHREFVDKIPLTELALQVADVQGSGMVRDLQEAVSLDPTIYELLNRIDGSYSRDEALKALDDVLLAWSKTSTMTSSVEFYERGVNRVILHPKGVLLQGDIVDISQMLSILEKFNGELFFGNADGKLTAGNDQWSPIDYYEWMEFDVVLSPQQTEHLYKSYEALKMGLYTAVMLDTRMKDYADDFRLGFNENAEFIVHMDAAIARVMRTQQAEGTTAAVEDLADLRSLGEVLPFDWSWIDILEDIGAHATDLDEFAAATYRLMGVLGGGTTVGGTADDVIVGTAGNDVLDGGLGNDEIRGGAGDDLIEGGQGSNTLWGGAGNDVLSVHQYADENFLAGGTGADILIGSHKSDTYLFNKGDGHDTIVETGRYSVISNDTLVFGVGLRAEDIQILRDGNDVLLKFGEGQDTVRLKDWLHLDGQENYAASIERIVFADGTEWTPEDIRAQITTIGTDGNDEITGWRGNDLIYGGAGDDIIDGDFGTNELYGEAGNDILKVHSLSSQNILAGGTGDDILIGSYKDDTYLFNKGDGHDTIVETSTYSASSNDTLKLGEGLHASDMKVLRDGLDVLLQFGDGADTVRLKDWLTLSLNENVHAGIDRLVFADGTEWSSARIRSRLTTEIGDDGGTVLGWQGDDLIYGGAGNDVIDGSYGSNELHGGGGDDVLSVHSSASNNIFVGGTGNDTMTGSHKSDTYLFNKGDGHDTIIELSQYSTSSIDTLVFGAGLEAADITVFREGFDVVLRFADGAHSVRLKDWLTSSLAENSLSSMEVIRFADGTEWTAANLRARLTTLGTEGNDEIVGWQGNDLILAGAGDDTVNGGLGSNELHGGAGNDVLRVHSLSDGNVFVGGTGDDLLYGSDKSDTYRFNKGDGRDTIVELSQYSTSSIDTLEFGAGLNAADVQVLREGFDVVLRFGDGSDSVRLKDWLTASLAENSLSSMEVIRFGDGTVWTAANLRAQLTTLGTDGADTLVGWQGNDLILAGAGDDIVDGGLGRNELHGGAGNDTLSVHIYSDQNVLVGGTGNDTLIGSHKSDTYLFNLGDGHDTIIELSQYSTSSVDTIVFGAGLNPADIQIVREGLDVVLRFANGTDSVRLKDWLTSSLAENSLTSIEKLQFADGTEWTAATLRARLTTFGTDGGDDLTGWQGNDLILAGAGDDTVNGGLGSNELHGGAGNDILRVHNLSDGNVFVGGTGDDMLYGSDKSDTYVFNKGDGHDTIVELSQYSTSSIDTLVLGEGLDVADLRVIREGRDVVLSFGDGSDSIRIKDWLTEGLSENYGAGIEKIVFAAGQRWSAADIRAQLTTLGTEGDDVITGWYGDDLILGGAGNDVIDGGMGRNELHGGAGNDTLRVHNLSDRNVFVGGTGDDVLYGSDKSDTYVFNKGDGRDTIVELSQYSTTSIDTLVLGEGLNLADLRVLREGQDVVLSFGDGSDSIRIKDWLTKGLTENYGAGIEKIVFAAGQEWTAADIRAQLTTLGTDGGDTLTGWYGNDLILGGDGDDVIDGGQGRNLLYGGDGNDTLSVHNYADGNVLAGGTGDDVLIGSHKSDTYLFNKGDGHDTIVELSQYSTSSIDTVVFGAGLEAADVQVLREGFDVVLSFGDGTDSVRIKDWLTATLTENSAASIEKLQFADGTEWTAANLRAQLTTLGTDGDDTLTGWYGNDLIQGGAGNDIIDGGQGRNHLYGGDGNDTLSVHIYADGNVLAGGAGDDVLIGSHKSDTYLFNKGDGHDTIVELSQYSTSSIDTLVLGAGLEAADVQVLREGLDVVLSFGDGSDSVRIKDWLTTSLTENSSASIEKLQFADGTEWTAANLRAQLTTLGTDGDDEITGWYGNDLILGGAGNDVIDGGQGSNHLYGGDGDDTLSVHYSSDNNVLAGGTGNDVLKGSDKSDTYLFNKGDGHDTVVETSQYSMSSRDEVIFGEGLLSTDALFHRSGNDLKLGFGHEEDTLTFQGWFASSGAQVENLKFADGRNVGNAELNSLIAAMAQTGSASSPAPLAPLAQQNPLMLAAM
jgi:Ca2+-binding RTX toxin-like protein